MVRCVNSSNISGTMPNDLSAPTTFTDWTQNYPFADKKRKRNDDPDDHGNASGKKKKEGEKAVAIVRNRIKATITGQHVGSIDIRLAKLREYYKKTYGEQKRYNADEVADIECASQFMLYEVRMDILLHAWKNALEKGTSLFELPTMLMKTNQDHSPQSWLPYIDPFGDRHDLATGGYKVMLALWEELRAIMDNGRIEMMRLKISESACLFYNTLRAATIMYSDPKVPLSKAPVCRYDPTFEAGKKWLQHARKLVRATTTDTKGFPKALL